MKARIVKREDGFWYPEIKLWFFSKYYGIGGTGELFYWESEEFIAKYCRHSSEKEAVQTLAKYLKYIIPNRRGAIVEFADVNLKGTPVEMYNALVAKYDWLEKK